MFGKKDEKTTDSIVAENQETQDLNAVSGTVSEKPKESFKRKLIPVFFGIGVFLF